MLKLESKIIEQIGSCTKVEELWQFLQNAIELEHATIPVYMTGLFSIKQGCNTEVRNIIRSVLIEEMLHMSIACNVLNAIGGSPDIDNPDFVPKFPGALPMGVGSDRGLVASLAPLSKEQLKSVFMAIEEPEDVLDFPVKEYNLLASKGEYSTIGEFYDAIEKKIEEFGDDIFIADHSRQLANCHWFPDNELWPVTDVKSAVKALELIKIQGEGTSSSPLDPESELSHYYRFAEIFYGRKLVPDSSEQKGWSYSGDIIPLDSDGIYPLMENAKAEDYPEGSVERRYADQANYTYSSMLNLLHQTFNGKPALIDNAMGIMYELRLTVQKMVTIPLDDSGKHAAPPFQYVTTNI